MQILLTAFKNTSSETLVKSIKEYDRLILENDKIKSVSQLEKALQNENFRYILSFGQRPVIKDKIHIEDRASINGELLETSFNITRLKRAFDDHKIVVKLSHNAGTSYCNNIYYHGMRMIVENHMNTEMVFIHIPFMKNISHSADFFCSVKKGIIDFISEVIMTKIDINDLDRFFVKSDLIPTVAFDIDSKTVLMLAYMNKESLKKTLETGYTWYWSRSRNELWNKGATSGHLQRVISIYSDCDDDTLLLNVKQTGAACHTGSYSCFFNKIYGGNDD